MSALWSVLVELAGVGGWGWGGGWGWLEAASEQVTKGICGEYVLEMSPMALEMYSEIFF